jgi:flagellar protein FliO/FliZ
VDASQAAGPSAGGGLVRTIVGLAIVIAVIYGLYWVLKQVKSSREERASGQGLGTLATLPLGPNRALHLVRAGGEIVLLGVGEGGVTPIRTYGEHEARALGLLAGEDDDTTPGGPTAAAGLPGVPGGRDRVGFGRALRRSLDDLRAKTVIK